MSVCKYCGQDINDAEQKICFECGSLYHIACWARVGKCISPECNHSPINPQGFFTSAPKLCQRCGAIIKDGQFFCTACGASVNQSSQAPNPAQTYSQAPSFTQPQTYSQTPNQTPLEQRCVRCGNQLTAGATVCPVCGQAVVSVASSVNPEIEKFNNEQKKNKKKKIIIPIIISAVLLTVLILVFAGIPNLSDDEYVDTSTERGDSYETDWGDATATEAAYSETRAETYYPERPETETSASSLTYYERKLVGTWEGVAFLNENEEYMALPAGSAYFYAYSDFTGLMTVKSDTGTSRISFTWTYIKYSDGNYFYKLYGSDGSVCTMLIGDVNGTETLLVDIGTMSIFYQ